MAKIEAQILNGTPPYSIVVRKIGENTGNRCTANCGNFPVTFMHDEGAHNYYFIATDSLGCVFDSRDMGGTGIGSVNCETTAPSFLYDTTPIICVGEDLTAGNVRVYNISNITRYKVCYGTTIFNCSDCETSTGVVTPGQDINVVIPLSTPGTNSDYSIRLFNGADCEVYSDINGSLYNPLCQSVDIPNFSSAVLQPSCSSENGGVIQSAVLKLSNITNATRYKLCPNSSVFTSGCQATCSNSDGIISSTSIDISIPAPAQGAAQDVTIRIFNGPSCNYYKDYSFSLYSQNCNISELSVMNLDLQVFQNASGARCDQPLTYQVEYDFQIRSTTPGVAENSQKVRTTTGAERTLPNGNDVPNTFIAAGFKAVCAQPSDSVTNPGVPVNNIFYRYTWNMSLLKAKYPNINEFSFDVYANKLRDNGLSTYSNSIRPRINAFTGVTLIKQLYNNNSNDASRNPPYAGSSCYNQGCPDPNDIFTNTVSTMPDVIYKNSIAGLRKIGTIKYNYTTNKVTWTEFPQ